MCETNSLFYYCNITTLSSILSNKKLWFTRFTDCKDPTEDNLFLRLFSDYVKSDELQSEEKKFEFDEYFVRTANQNNASFGMSLSSSGDNLALWQNFVGNQSGACIEFNLSKLVDYISYFKCCNKNLELKNVKYIDVENYKRNDELLGTMKSIIGMNNGAYLRILEETAIWKSNTFKDEQESRIVFRAYDKEEDKPNYHSLKKKNSSGEYEDICFCITDGRIRYEFPIDLSLICKIIIDPRSSNDIDQNRCFIKIDGDINIELVPSSFKQYLPFTTNSHQNFRNNNKFDFKAFRKKFNI